MVALMEMGHGDEIILADANFPAVSHARRLVRAHGLSIPPLLEAILAIFPLDGYVDKPVVLMEPEAQDPGLPEIWSSYRRLLDGYLGTTGIAYVRRDQFYQRAKGAFAIVTTGEVAMYGNILLKKGPVDTVTVRGAVLSDPMTRLVERQG